VALDVSLQLALLAPKDVVPSSDESYACQGHEGQLPAHYEHYDDVDYDGDSWSDQD
jgi:hypothetical protein